MSREPPATMHPTPQDNQLMSKLRVLSFKPHLRLEWRGQDGQSETEQPDHSASLGDSITSSTRIRFSVHTAGTVVETNFGNVLILLLLDDSGIAQGASPETALDEEIMQLDQRGQPGRRRAAHCIGVEHGDHRADASDNGLQLPPRHGQNEREMALGRKNHLFAGSDGGAARWAVVASLIATDKLKNVEPFAYLRDVLERT